jgi:hypothetical protein
MVTSHQNVITENEYELLEGWNNFVLFPISLSQEGIADMRRMICDFLSLQDRSTHRSLFPSTLTEQRNKRRKEKLMIFGISRRLIDPFFFALYSVWLMVCVCIRIFLSLTRFLPSRAELKPLVKLKARTISQHLARTFFLVFSKALTVLPMINDSNINIDSINCTRH